MTVGIRKKGSGINVVVDLDSLGWPGESLHRFRSEDRKEGEGVMARVAAAQRQVRFYQATARTGKHIIHRIGCSYLGKNASPYYISGGGSNYEMNEIIRVNPSLRWCGHCHA